MMLCAAALLIPPSIQMFSLCPVMFLQSRLGLCILRLTAKSSYSNIVGDESSQ